MENFFRPTDDLSQQATRERIAMLTDEFVQGMQMRKARHLASEIRDALNRAQLSVEDQTLYETLRHRLLFSAFSILNSEGEQEKLFERGIAAALRDEYIFPLDRVRAYLIELNVPDRDPLKKRWRDAMLRNGERLTTALFVDRQGRHVEPTVQRWLRTLRAAAVEGEWPTELEKAMFFSNEKNFRVLVPAEQEVVRKLLALFEALQKSSMTIEGIEEEIVFEQNGRLKELNKETYQIEDVFPIERIASALPERERATLSALRDAAERGALAEWLNVANDPAAVREELRRALMEGAGLSEAESAREALELAHLSAKAGKPDYLDIAYFDEATKTFQWRE
jgi:hypothetical protein